MEASEAVDTEVGVNDANPGDAPYYCPGCGARSNYPKACTGRAEAPHQPIEVIPTGELAYEHDPTASEGEKGYHTPAPDTENLG